VLFYFNAFVLDHSQKKMLLYEPYYKYLKAKPIETLNSFFFKAQTTKKIIALTFDDGPLGNSSKITGLLSKNNVKATFFLVTSNINAGNIKGYLTKGFELGMHTYKHSNYGKFSLKEKEDDINKCIQIFTSNKLELKYFRPAYGVIDADIASILKTKNLKGILWSIDSFDWNKVKGQQLIDRIINNLCEGGIILMHDSIDVSTLEKLIVQIKSKGYEIVSLSELLKYKNELP
jgi:peptidoglycan/xylan/chitin deacetylase (PgdA/CDA1 family)